MLWDTGENRDVDKVNHFHSLKALDWLSELDEEFVSVAWISSHQIAIGLWKKRTIMINELDDDKGTSRIVKQFRHSKHQGGLFCHLTDLKWNERTKFLASSSWDTRIKVIYFRHEQLRNEYLLSFTVSWLIYFDFTL